MTDITGCIQATTTLDSREAAVVLAQDVVAARLVACVQVTGPLTSVYRWQGAVEQATEWACVMKTTQSRLPALETWIARHHPYETPELVAVPIVGGAAGYLRWVVTEASAD